jgi:hypothetical protein
MNNNLHPYWEERRQARIKKYKALDLEYVLEVLPDLTLVGKVGIYFIIYRSIFKRWLERHGMFL